MNLILFAEEVLTLFLPSGDPRSRHVRDVLRCREGEGFDVGVIHGKRGRAVVEAWEADGCRLRFLWGEEPSAALPCALWVAFPRPTTARRILREGASLGVARMVFFGAERGEASYAQSRLWSGEGWREQIIAGTEQAFHTRVPAVVQYTSLAEAIAREDAEVDATRIALDVYEAACPLREIGAGEGAVTMAVGPERGWSAKERQQLRESGFQLAHLGERVLRSDTACVAAVSGLAQLRGWCDRPWCPEDRVNPSRYIP